MAIKHFVRDESGTPMTIIETKATDSIIETKATDSIIETKATDIRKNEIGWFQAFLYIIIFGAVCIVMYPFVDSYLKERERAEKGREAAIREIKSAVNDYTRKIRTIKDISDKYDEKAEEISKSDHLDWQEKLKKNEELYWDSVRKLRETRRQFGE